MRVNRLVVSALVLGGLAGACSTSGKTNHWIDPTPQDAPHVTPPPYWSPTPGSAPTWDIQLAPPYDLGAVRDLWVIPLWAAVPAPTSLDYGDGAPVAVPKGALASTILTLHATRPTPRIVCEFGTTSVDLTEPDAAKFPGFEANPPDFPTAPKAGSVIGWSTTLRPHRRWLDVRTPATADAIAKILAARYKLAKDIGCDGVLPDDNDWYQLRNPDNSGQPGDATGFPPNGMGSTIEVAWVQRQAAAAHAQLLSVGLRDLTSEPGAVVADFDWYLLERCGEADMCDTWAREFLQVHKAVFGVEYTTDSSGAQQNPNVCKKDTATGIDGILKDAALTGSSWFLCSAVGGGSGSGSALGSPR